MLNFSAQNGPFSQIRIFFRKPVNEPCVSHSCLSTCQKSKSDIYLLVKYWRLKNTVWEPFLSITWEPDFFQAWSFRIMLMNYKNFHFTKVPDKTKKVQKPCFWAIFDQFWSFLPNGDFFKKIWLSHVTIYGPLIPY